MKKTLLLVIASLMVAFSFTGCFGTQAKVSIADCKEIDGSKCLTVKEILPVNECKNPITVNKKIYCKGEK